jgi:hypothetical protein
MMGTRLAGGREIDLTAQAGLVGVQDQRTDVAADVEYERFGWAL